MAAASAMEQLPEFARALIASGEPPKLYTLVICIQGSRILLGEKKRGFGTGYFNGFGGKVEPGETIEAAAIRELQEESGLSAHVVHHRGILTFLFDDQPRPWEVHVFAVHEGEWAGQPTESDEMRPVWVEQSAIPFHKMWADDELWYPLFLAGKTLLGVFAFTQTHKMVSHHIRVVDSIQASEPRATMLALAAVAAAAEGTAAAGTAAAGIAAAAASPAAAATPAQPPAAATEGSSAEGGHALHPPPPTTSSTTASTLPAAGGATTMMAPQPRLFGQPTSRTNYGVQQWEVRAAGSVTGTFQQWLAAVPDEVLVRFFRDATAELEVAIGLQDYHLKLQNNFDAARRQPLPGWGLVVFYGSGSAGEAGEEDGPSGPLQVDRCMSCDLGTPLSLGVLGRLLEGGAGPTAADSLLQETAHCRCWLDAKARPMVVVTPKRHHERLSGLSDAELADLWRTAAALLAQTRCSTFQSMILNHGNNRNHAHLHLKVRVSEAVWRTALRSWPQDHQQKLGLLRAFAEAHVPAHHQQPRHLDLAHQQATASGQPHKQAYKQAYQ